MTVSARADHQPTNEIRKEMTMRRCIHVGMSSLEQPSDSRASRNGLTTKERKYPFMRRTNAIHACATETGVQEPCHNAPPTMAPAMPIQISGLVTLCARM